MKIYRDIKAILKENLSTIIILGVVLPIAFKPMMSALSNSGFTDAQNFYVIIILLIVFACSIAFYFLYSLLVHLFNYKRPTIEVTTTGLRYPYFLKDDVEIPWENIKDIEYFVDTSHDRIGHFMVIVLEENVKMVELKKNPGLSIANAIQKKYASRVLVVFKNLVYGYSLSDLTDRLNAERKSLTAPPQFINNEPILYEKRTEPLIEILKRLGIEMLIGIAVVIYFFIYGAQNTQMRNYVLIFLGIVAFIIVMKFINHIKLLSAPTTALCFDEHGISIINDQAFAIPIAWSDVQHVELRTQKQSPILIIEATDVESREVKSYEIKNDLKDTSVYEVMSSLKYYL